jgi:hypothetical protein
MLRSKAGSACQYLAHEDITSGQLRIFLERIKLPIKNNNAVQEQDPMK